MKARKCGDDPTLVTETRAFDWPIDAQATLTLCATWMRIGNLHTPTALPATSLVSLVADVKLWLASILMIIFGVLCL